MKGARILLVLLACALALSAPARGAIWAGSPTAVIQLAPHVTPYPHLDPAFSILAWVHPEATSTGTLSIFELPGVLGMGTDDQGRVRAWVRAVEDGEPEPIQLTITTNAPLLGGQWQLVVMTYSNATGVLDVFVRNSAGQDWASGRGPIGADTLNQPAGGPRLGASSEGVPAMVGAYGLLVVRTDIVDANAVSSLYALRRHFGLYDLDAGAMTGPDGAVWMLNHTVSTLPVDIDAGGTAPERAAVIGEPVGKHNVHVYDKAVDAGEEFDRFIMVRDTDIVSGFHYASYREPPLDGFFLIDPGVVAVVYPSVPGPSPLAAQLVGEPRRPIRVMVSANSRGVSRDDGTNLSPGNYAHGFIDLKRSQTAGVFFRPAARRGENPWFGLDCSNTPMGDRIWFMDANNNKYQHFTRFWTGSVRATAEGPGSGLFVEWGGYYQMRCRPEPGSLLIADAPLVVEAHVMAFPGASTLAWTPNRGPSQNAPGIDVAPTRFLELNTQTYSTTYGPDDRILNSTAFVLKGQHGDFINPGDAMFISAGPGAGHLSIIRTVSQGITQCTFEVTMPMANLPALGAVLHFGPWHFEKVSHTFDPVPDGDPNTWRGLHLAAPDLGEGFPVFALSAWRPDVDGYIFGAAGWGGNGYFPQILFSEDEARTQWIAQSQTDLWLQVPAQQNTTAEHMVDFTNEIRAGLPECEIVWAAEAAHPSGTLPGWSEFIVDHAAENGVVGISSLNRVAVGSDLEQLADGHRSNLPHLSARGNLILAETWCDLLADAALDPCPADFAPPWGVYDFFDVQSFLASFAAEGPTADLNEDGAFDFFDIQNFLNALAAGCP